MKLLFLLLISLCTPVYGAHAAQDSGAGLYLEPDSQILAVGETVDIRVFATTGGKAVHAIEGELAYNPTEVTVEKISIEGSILQSFATPPSYDDATGLLKFSGWTPANFVGSKGLLLTITLSPRKVGQSALQFNSGSILEVGGAGSNIITTMRSGVYRIDPKQIHAPQPDTQQATTTMSRTSTATSTRVPTLQASTDTSSPENAAAVALSGFELAPLLAPFMLLLTAIAFCIAYAIHRLSR